MTCQKIISPRTAKAPQLAKTLATSLSCGAARRPRGLGNIPVEMAILPAQNEDFMLIERDMGI